MPGQSRGTCVLRAPGCSRPARLSKDAGTRQRTPWHQGPPQDNVEGHQNVSFWIPVDRASRAATLEFAAGSHKGPWLMPRTFMTHEAKRSREGSLADLPDIWADRSAFNILGWALEPGNAVAFNRLTLHASAGAPMAGFRSDTLDT